MNRRSLLAASVGVLASGTAAGCLGGVVEEGDGQLDVGGTSVPLASTETAADWFDSGDLLVLDARGESEWEEIRIAGAEWSPARDGRESNDPTEGVAANTHILTYCVCPHTLAGQRGAALIEDGYTDVYALDEGLDDWIDQGHPIEGTDVNESGEAMSVPTARYHDG